jgi:hypothetical protein
MVHVLTPDINVLTPNYGEECPFTSINTYPKTCAVVGNSKVHLHYKRTQSISNKVFRTGWWGRYLCILDWSSKQFSIGLSREWWFVPVKPENHKLYRYYLWCTVLKISFIKKTSYEYLKKKQLELCNCASNHRGSKNFKRGGGAPENGPTLQN